MSSFWILLELRMMEVVSGDNWSYKSCKAPAKSSPPTNQHPVVMTTGTISHAMLQSNCHHQQTYTQFFTGQHPVFTGQSTEGKNITFTNLLTPSSPGGLPTLSLTTNSSWLPWGGLPCQPNKPIPSFLRSRCTS